MSVWLIVNYLSVGDDPWADSSTSRTRTKYIYILYTVYIHFLRVLRVESCRLKGRLHSTLGIHVILAWFCLYALRHWNSRCRPRKRHYPLLFRWVEASVKDIPVRQMCRSKSCVPVRCAGTSYASASARDSILSVQRAGAHWTDYVATMSTAIVNSRFGRLSYLCRLSVAA